MVFSGPISGEIFNSIFSGERYLLIEVTVPMISAISISFFSFILKRINRVIRMD